MGNKGLLIKTNKSCKDVLDTHAAFAPISVEAWTIPYSIPTYKMRDNGAQVVSEFFEMLCAFLGKKHLTKAAYYLQTNNQPKGFKQTIIA